MTDAGILRGIANEIWANANEIGAKKYRELHRIANNFDSLQAENERLKEEVDRLNESLEKFADGHDKLIEETVTIQSKLDMVREYAEGCSENPVTNKILDLLK